MGIRLQFYAPLRGLSPVSSVVLSVALLGMFALAVGLGASCQSRPVRGPLADPPIVLWAWERAEDLRFLAALPELHIGVAYLHASVFLHGPGVSVRRRAGSLQLPPGVWQLPVVHIEADRAFLPTLQAGQRKELLRVIKVELARAGTRRLQLDFEAKPSQREFYRQFISELRAELGPHFPLSVTALVSWCYGERWLAELPVDEIVPMFYRMGAEGPRLRAELGRGIDLAPECRRAHGLITDEPMVLPRSPRRLYLFAPTAWTQTTLQTALTKLRSGGLWQWIGLTRAA